MNYDSVYQVSLDVLFCFYFDSRVMLNAGLLLVNQYFYSVILSFYFLLCYQHSNMKLNSASVVITSNIRVDMQVMSNPPATNKLNSHAAWLSGRGMWEAGEDYLWSKDNEKKKKGCLILNSNTWRITDRLVLFLTCQVTLLACTGQCLAGRGSAKTLCKIHCFSMQHVSRDK